MDWKLISVTLPERFCPAIPFLCLRRPVRNGLAAVYYHEISAYHTGGASWGRSFILNVDHSPVRARCDITPFAQYHLLQA